MGTELFRAEDVCGDGCGSSSGSSAREREEVVSPFTSCMLIRLPSSNIILGGLMWLVMAMASDFRAAILNYLEVGYETTTTTLAYSSPWQASPSLFCLWLWSQVASVGGPSFASTPRESCGGKHFQINSTPQFGGKLVGCAAAARHTHRAYQP